MNRGFVGCRYYENSLKTQYTISVERENVILNRKLSQVLKRNKELHTDLEEANAQIDALDEEVERLSTLCDYAEVERYCEPEVVGDENVKISPIILTNKSHGNTIVIHRGEGEETEKEGENVEEETEETPEKEVSDEEVVSSGDVEVKSGGDVEVSNSPKCDWGDWTYSIPLDDIARY